MTFRPARTPAFLVASRWIWLKYAGTVMTACGHGSPSRNSASALTFLRIRVEISIGESSLASHHHAHAVARAFARLDDLVAAPSA